MTLSQSSITLIPFNNSRFWIGGFCNYLTWNKTCNKQSYFWKRASFYIKYLVKKTPALECKKRHQTHQTYRTVSEAELCWQRYKWNKTACFYFLCLKWMYNHWVSEQLLQRFLNCRTSEKRLFVSRGDYDYCRVPGTWQLSPLEVGENNSKFEPK